MEPKVRNFVGMKHDVLAHIDSMQSLVKRVEALQYSKDFAEAAVYLARFCAVIDGIANDMNSNNPEVN